MCLDRTSRSPFCLMVRKLWVRKAGTGLGIEKESKRDGVHSALHRQHVSTSGHMRPKTIRSWNVQMTQIAINVRHGISDTSLKIYQDSWEWLIWKRNIERTPLEPYKMFLSFNFVAYLDFRAPFTSLFIYPIEIHCISALYLKTCFIFHICWKLGS